MNIHETVTERILAELDKGIIPWAKPWISLKDDIRKLAFNRFSKKPYSLLNQILLDKSGEWATFAQWSSIGGKVKKGEKSSICVFFKPVMKEDSSEISDSSDVQNNKIVSHFVLKYYNVFHISQVENVVELSPEELGIDLSSCSDFSPIEQAEKTFLDYIAREKIRLSYGGNQAFFSPCSDSITLPDRRQFNGNANAFYATAFHECAHSTGMESRLNRNLLDRADNAYDKEELVAEIASASILSSLGIENESTFNNSVAYIQSWSTALRKNKNFFINACLKAQKAVEFIFGKESALA